MDATRPEKLKAARKYLTRDKTIMYLTKYNMNQSQLANMFGVSCDWMKEYIKRLHINIENERKKYKATLPKVTKPIGKHYSILL